MKLIEPNASLMSERIDTMKKAHSLGIKTFGMICPVLPGIGNDPESYEQMLSSVLECDPEAIWTEPLNPRGPGIARCMACAEPHLRWAMEVCFNLGTRPGESELLSLRWENVDFVAGTVRIYASKTKTYRTVPINPEFLKRMVLTFRQVLSDDQWAGPERFIRISFWGLNIGLALMAVGSLFPGGVLQFFDVLQHGYWHARSLEYLGKNLTRTIEWARMPGDVIFIVAGVVPMVIAAIMTYFRMRASALTNQRN